MDTKRSLILTMSLIFALACSVSMGGEPTPVPPAVVIPPAQVPLPTYTPFPTYTVVAPPPVQATATVAAPPTSSTPLLTQNLLKVDDTVRGTTESKSQLFYFYGREGDVVTITLTSDLKDPTFSLRDEDNEGLTGCEAGTIYDCRINEYRLPYSGVYYILVDKIIPQSMLNRYSCGKDPNPSSWCYMGSPFTLTLTMK